MWENSNSALFRDCSLRRWGFLFPVLPELGMRRWIPKLAWSVVLDSKNMSRIEMMEPARGDGESDMTASLYLMMDRCDVSQHNVKGVFNLMRVNSVWYNCFDFKSILGLQ